MPSAKNSSSSPNAVSSSRHPEGSLCFELVFSDVGLECSPLFQPTGVSVVLRRHRRRWSSERTGWEASLKSPREGFCFWHPPFAAKVVVSQPRGGGKEAVGEHHKDVFVSVENQDSKGKKKLLAKARVDLMEYRETKTKYARVENEDD